MRFGAVINMIVDLDIASEGYDLKPGELEQQEVECRSPEWKARIETELNDSLGEPGIEFKVVSTQELS